MNCPAVEILMEIRDLLRDLDTLEERRAKDREHKRLVRRQNSCLQTKEEEKGKEGKSPHTPLKEVKGSKGKR